MHITAYDNVQGPHLADVETPTCPHCGQTGWVTITAEQLEALTDGALIQDALASTPRALREQIKTGHHPQCWQELYGN